MQDPKTPQSDSPKQITTLELSEIIAKDIKEGKLDKVFQNLYVLFSWLSEDIKDFPDLEEQKKKLDKIIAKPILAALRRKLESQYLWSRRLKKTEISKVAIEYFSTLKDSIPQTDVSHFLEVTRDRLEELHENPDEFDQIRQIFVVIINLMLIERITDIVVEELVKSEKYTEAVDYVIEDFDHKYKRSDTIKNVATENRLSYDTGHYIAYIFYVYCRKLMAANNQESTSGIEIKEMFTNFISLIKTGRNILSILVSLLEYLGDYLEDNKTQDPDLFMNKFRALLQSIVFDELRIQVGLGRQGENDTPEA